MLNIPPNNFTEDTRCDESVVQGICNAFLADNAWHIYHPFSEGAYRQRDAYVEMKGGAFVSWREAEGKQGYAKFTNAEMDLAVEELKKAGYYLYRRYDYGSWVAYFFSPKPYLDPSYRAERVDTVPHFS